MYIVQCGMLDAYEKQRSVFYIKKKYSGQFKTCYMDQNIFTQYIHDEISIEELNIPKDYIIVYSPAHIEELSKAPKDYHKDELIEISNKIGDREILYVDDFPTIVEENPIYTYHRVNDKTKARELAEEYKILQDEFEELCLGNYRTSSKRKIYNSTDPDSFIKMHKEMVNEILRVMQRSYTLEDILKQKNICQYSLLNKYIHDLYTVLDICGVKKDNSERKIRSSRLDIEHLLYAANTDLFLTKDKKLRCRACNIFSILNKDVVCPVI